MAERTEKTSNILSSDAYARILDFKTELQTISIEGGSHPQSYLSFFSELHGVAEQVDQDLAQPLAVHQNLLGNAVVPVEIELHSLPLGGPTNDLQRLGKELLDGAGGEVEVHFPGVDLGQIQDIADQLHERLTAGTNRFQVFLLLLVQVGVVEQVGHPQYPVQRSPEFVIQVAEEASLGFVLFLQIPRSLDLVIESQLLGSAGFRLDDGQAVKGQAQDQAGEGHHRHLVVG